MGAEGLEVWDDKLLPEGLREQNDVALDTPETGDTTLPAMNLGRMTNITRNLIIAPFSDSSWYLLNIFCRMMKHIRG